MADYKHSNSDNGTNRDRSFSKDGKEYADRPNRHPDDQYGDRPRREGRDDRNFDGKRGDARDQRRDRSDAPRREGRDDRNFDGKRGDARDQRRDRSDAPRREGRNDRNFDGKRGDARDQRRDRSDTPHGRAMPGDRPRGATAALIDLDRDLMKLLVRRATLVSRIRGGKDHAASPAAIQSEKAVRIAWEAGAANFSKDPRFSRQLFSLLQDISVMSKEQAETSGSFTLSPASRAVSGEIFGPTATRTVQMQLFLSAVLGKELDLESVMLSSPLMDSLKSCEQAGALVSHTPKGYGLSQITLAEGGKFSCNGKTIYVGDDPLSLYLMVFLSLGTPGTCRFNGGSRLKEKDLTHLRHILPFFGARLAHVIPRSVTLPVNLECSGELPAAVAVPAELSFGALCALLLAPLTWNREIVLDLSALPASTASSALNVVRPLYRDAGVEVETRGPNVVFHATAAKPPKQPEIPLDPVLSAYLLAIPVFAGGQITLRGVWPEHMLEARQAEQLLGWAGVTLTRTETGVRAEMGDKPFTLPMQGTDIVRVLGPLYLALTAKYRVSKKMESFPHIPPFFPQEEQDEALAREFFTHLGYTLEDGRLTTLTTDGEREESPAWASPNGFWSMAYALAAYIRKGISLSNPASATDLVPFFWSVYNSLPTPTDPATERNSSKESEEDVKPVRRRIMADD